MRRNLPGQDTGASLPVGADDDAPASNDAADPAPAPPATTPAAAVLHHVVINATTLTYRRSSVHVTSAPHDAMAAAATPASQATAQAAEPAVKRLDADAFASLRGRTVERSSETALTLKLTTQEGDLVELVFQQLDVTSRTRLAGVTDSGSGVRAKETAGSRARYVNMQITGDLSDAEKSAIDEVLQQVIDVANQFFHGDMQAAIERLGHAQIDTDQLSEFSLQMSMNDSRQVDKFASGDDGLQRWLHRDSAVSRTLEFLADQQQQLIKAASTRFDERSAVTLVKHLLPAMIAPPDAPAESTPATDGQDAPTAPSPGTPTA